MTHSHGLKSEVSKTKEGIYYTPKCDCICHFDSRSVGDTAEGKKIGCGQCNFTGMTNYFAKGENRQPFGRPQPFTEKCFIVPGFKIARNVAVPPIAKAKGIPAK
jgi:hypothetical protein